MLADQDPRDVATEAQQQITPAHIVIPGEASCLGVSQDQLTEEFARAISMPVQQESANIAMTPTTRTRCSINMEGTSLRRSKRIACMGASGTALDRAQTVLMRKMGLITEMESISQEAREAYTRLFEHPLSRSHLSALAALFG